MAAEQGQVHLAIVSSDPDDADSNQPSGQQSHEVLKELMEVKQELARVNAEMLVKTEEQKQRLEEQEKRFEKRIEEQEKRIKEQECKSKELLDQLEGNGAGVRSTEENRKPNMKELRVDTAFQLTSEQDLSPKLDKKGIVRGGQEVYAFNESVWDSLIFLGHIQGAYEGVDMIILGILNLVIQIFFCVLLVTLNLADTGTEVYTEAVNAFIQWRIGVAHQAEHYDPLTNSSLAQRVCLQYGGTIESRRHQNDLAVATGYYDVTRETLSEFQGPGLLMLALALWMALILKEVVSILGFTRMLLALVLNGHGKTELVTEEFGNQLEIRSMSKTRAWSIFFTVVVPRLFISLMLGYVGIFYLRQTFSVEEIILNAMALGFVLEIDELLFSFLPAAARYLVAHVDAVPLDLKGAEDKLTSTTKQSSVRKLFAAIFERTRILLVILVIVVIYFRFTIIAQIQDSMEISQLILCEGKQEFIFKQSRATKVLHLAQTVNTHGAKEMDLPLDEIQDVFDAILQATELCIELEKKKDLQDRLELCSRKDDKEPGMWCDRCPYLLSLGPDSQLWKDESLEDTITLVTATRNEALSSLECEDRYTTLNETFIPAPMNELLAEAGANFSAALCIDMEPYCLHPDLQIREVVRIFCPSQCQCDHGTSSTVNKWFFDRTGCAPTCQGLVNAELTQLEDDLVLGKETCTDRDGGLSEEQWRSYVEDVEREFVKRGWLYAEGGFYYASDSIAGFFAVKTDKDMSDFAATVLHSSNRPSIRVDGCTLPRVPIDLVAWVKTAGSLCRWLRIVKYVFGINLCSHSILLADGFYGFNALGGLCPLSCGIGSCSQIQPDGDIDSNLNAWYNVVPWGRDSKYNFACDREELLCVEVEKWSRQYEHWHGMTYLKILADVANETLLYEGGLDVPYGMDAYEKDVACMRPVSNSSCYVIVSEPKVLYTSWFGMRWRLTEVGTGQFLVVGSFGETHRACGSYWLDDLGVQCHHGDTVTMMTSWHEMQVDYQLMVHADPHAPAAVADDFFLRGIQQSMFASRRAHLEGGYDGTSVQIMYSQAELGGRDIVPLSKLAVPTTQANAGQGFAACLPSSQLAELRQDKRLCVDGNVAPLECSEFVSRAYCETTIGFVREVFQTHGCESDLDGLSDDDTIAQLCPEACAIQAACPVEVDNDEYFFPSHGWSHYSAYYYTFEMAGCLSTDCECLPPFEWEQGHPSVLASCWMELNFTYNFAKDFIYQTYYFAFGSSTTTTTWPDEVREKIGLVIKEGIYCASEETGFLPRNFHLTNMSQWCYVRPTCLGARPSLNAATCSWRPTFETDCKADRSYPGFCLWGCGPYSCWCETDASHFPFFDPFSTSPAFSR